MSLRASDNLYASHRRNVDFCIFMFFFGHDVLYYIYSLISTIFSYYYITYDMVISFIFKNDTYNKPKLK
jgi:hypothetical protein